MQSTEIFETEADRLEAGLRHHRAGRLENAAPCYAQLLETKPSHSDALNLLGVIARQQNDLNTSERFILAAIRQNDRVATYHHHLGKTYAVLGRSREAAESYRRALSLNPEDENSLQLLAALTSEAGDGDAAEQGAASAAAAEDESELLGWSTLTPRVHTTSKLR